MGPLRGQPLGPERLADRAEKVARGQRVVEGRRKRLTAPLLARLNTTRRVLDNAHVRLAAYTAAGGDVGPAGDWLLDNFHVVQEHIREVHESLPRGYYRELPVLAEGRLAGYPRVYELAVTLISHTEGRVDLDSVSLFVAAFQKVAPLSIGELWAIPAMLRLGSLESVRRMTLRTVERLDEMDQADEWAARLEGASDDGLRALRRDLASFIASPPALTATMIARLLRRLRPIRGANPPLIQFEEWIADNALSAEEAGAFATHRLALTQLMMANSITSLHAITHADWRVFVEAQSVMEAVLREDPAGWYASMTFATRDHYRHVVERVAKRTDTDESRVARLAIELAEAGGKGARESHVGYYLIDAGLRTLEARFGYTASLGESVQRWIHRHPTVVYTGGLALGTTSALALVMRMVAPPSLGTAMVVLLVALLPATEVALTLVNQLVTTLLPPRLLPKLDLGEPEGIPPSLRTAVVVPILLGSTAAVRDALEHLEVQFLANRDPCLHFALLSDFRDSPTESRPEDASIIHAATEGIRDLNTRYAPTTRDAFFLFHRDRLWNATEGTWMGWERKRGKLGQFNAFLRGGENAFSTVVGDTTLLAECRYVITLDADTVLPPGAARVLVGAIAHPLNRAEFDAGEGRVTRGYGILQPRVGVSLPSAYRSRFASIHSGHPGVDPYTTAVSDVYQDLFGEGSFTGKGIYDVDAFEASTHGRFAENTLLSHDLIEGSYARAGLATDIILYDDYPAQYLSYSRRKRRWIRGDWQLVGWLLPQRAGSPRGHLSLLSRWKIFDNLRRSLLEIAQLALLVTGWIAFPHAALRWTLIGAGFIAAPWVIALVLAVLRPPFDRSWQAYYGAVWADAVVSAKQVVLAAAFLPHQAWSSASAILRTLWRLAVSRRHLLEWQTSSDAEQHASGSLTGVLHAMWPALATVAILGALIVRHAMQLGVGTTLLLAAVAPPMALWFASPLIARWLTRRPPVAERRLTRAAQELAVRYARLHWAYFDTFVSETTHWLAPDNFQDDPAPVVAMRTSPTNMGLQLMAVISAEELGFIDLDEMTNRLERTFASLTSMRRYRGHFYNWYNLHDLQVLEPAYISTVDSGNLAGHLLAVRQACAALPTERTVTPALAARLAALSERALAFVVAMEFGFLFDDTRKLFAIGYHEGSRTLDSSYYDLLASEARLASFVAIAKCDVPVDHWFHLDRTLTRSGGATALVSWSGSMFEYLMPVLVMRSLPFTVLAQTYRGAVDRQMAYGTERGVPWGVSESAYNLRDRHLTYQYRAFGVPDLALKRGLGRDLVVAPYASALAAMIDPQQSLANLERFEGKGALGEYGFRDAVDYTRPDPGLRYGVVHNYMAHHIGMSLVALTNALSGDVWQRRFHAEPLVMAAELLLHERIPRRLMLQEVQTARADEALPDPTVQHPFVRTVNDVNATAPRVALLGRLPYTIMLTHSGGGYSQYDGLAVTRWRADGTSSDTGQFCYLKDVGSGRVWSAAYQPVCAPADDYHALLATDRVTFERVDGDLETRTEIAVSPEDFAEVRRVTVTNTGTVSRSVELTSYGEIVLAPAATERAHPAFANLFVETEWHGWCSAITATRRPRTASEHPVVCVHVVAIGEEQEGDVTCETDRARFIGRGRSTLDPVALETDGPLSGTTGSVLDPVFALRVRVRVAPGQAASVSFTTLVATSRDRAFVLADRYHDPRTVQRALDLAWSATQMELRELSVTPAEAALYQDMAGHLFFPVQSLRAAQEEMRRNEGGQPLLWAQGISGDWPIVLASIEDVEGIDTLRQLFAAHHYWRRRGVMADLVIVNEHPPSYAQELAGDILDAMYASDEPDSLDVPGGVFLRRSDQMDPAARLMLRATARLHVRCDGRSLKSIMDGAPVPRAAPVLLQPPHPASRPETGIASPDDIASATRDFDNDIGDVTAAGAYELRVMGDAVPPAPWCNVVAHETGGFMVSERGAGSTWAGSSYFFRLTPWRNDPVSDLPGDALYLRDDESGELWSATPAPVRSDRPYDVTHRQGASDYGHRHAGIESTLTIGLSPDAAVRLSLLTLTNHSDRARRLTITAYAEWTLGALRENTQHQVLTAFNEEQDAVIARNYFDPQFAGWVAFSALSETVASHTGDRTAFLGRNGSMVSPLAIRAGAGPLDGVTGAGLDPCAALQCVIELAPGETREIAAVLGAAEGMEAALALVARYRDVPTSRDAINATVDAWTRRLAVVRVSTPDACFDAMLNHWTLYQALSCRMWARSALYQSSGAYGFRDQLQDVLAFLYAEPGVAREHILRAASRQFVEGDVQHWWHPLSGRGVRTRFSDDLVWLPYVVHRYVQVTGDRTVLDERVPFITMRELEPGEQEAYDLPSVSDETGTVYDHCLRALRQACTTGVHGLPLMGAGDWNDGMNRVGIEGRGESVWLAWFLIATLRDFAPVAASRGDDTVAAELRAHADAYAAAVEQNAWDGEWYRRAYYDDGTPLGSASQLECRIDSIAQSWSVISGAGNPERAAQSMKSFETHLVDEPGRMLLLLTPPFNRTPNDPGYIKGYLPGVRENGAQYTHAALWAVLATALRGDGDRAFALYQMLNPLTHTASPEGVARYRVEPYVVAADVYTATGQHGRGGWTWYTGSASWMYRIGLETLLGFTKRGARLTIQPAVPAEWPEFTIEYRYGGSTYVIRVVEPARVTAQGCTVQVDGVTQADGGVTLQDDGERHEVEIRPVTDGGSAPLTSANG